MKCVKMAVHSYLCFNIILILCVVYIESSEKPENGACVNDFTDLKGNKIDLEKHCKSKTCIPKCCGESQILFNNSNSMSCNNIIELRNKLAKPINMNVTVYNNINGKFEERIRSIVDVDFVFVRNKKMYQESCFAKAFEVDHFHIFENSSLIIEEQKYKLKGNVDMKNYCMDHIVHGIGTEIIGPAFYYKLAVPPPTTRPPPKKVCADRFTDLDGKPINIEDHCNNTHCIAKCCRAANRILYYAPDEAIMMHCESISKIQESTNTTINVNYSNIDIYRSNIEQKVRKSHMKLDSYFRIIMNKKMSFTKCASGIPFEPMNNFHILENDSLVLEMPNYYKRFLRHWSMGDFCFEHVVIKTKEEVKGPFVIYRYAITASNHTVVERNTTEDTLRAVALLISCFFLILVFCIYGVIRELRNLVGMVLMAYVGTLAVTFFFKAVELIATRNDDITVRVCKPMSVLLYYTTLSSFFWMNIMSLDIWWTFRGIFKSRPIHRRGELAKFGWYALYSWGTPLLVTIAVAVIDYSDLSHLPHIYKPHFELCFYMNDNYMEIRHYLFMPLLGLLFVDCAFFLMTAFNIWRIRKCMAQFTNEAGKYNKNQNRLGLYLKLSLVMGISWFLEFIQLPWYLERVAAAYNTLIGVAIFFIFVFKKKILFMLCSRFTNGKNRGFNQDKQRDESKAALKKQFSFINVLTSRISNPGPLQQTGGVSIKLVDRPATVIPCI